MAHESAWRWACSQNRADRQRKGLGLDERGGGDGGLMLLPEDVSDCLAMLGQCTELEGPGGQEAMIRMWST